MHACCRRGCPSQARNTDVNETYCPAFRKHTTHNCPPCSRLSAGVFFCGPVVYTVDTEAAAYRNISPGARQRIVRMVTFASILQSPHNFNSEGPHVTCVLFPRFHPKYCCIRTPSSNHLVPVHTPPVRNPTHKLATNRSLTPLQCRCMPARKMSPLDITDVGFGLGLAT